MKIHTQHRSMASWPYLMLFIILAWFYRGIFLAEGAWIVGDHAEQHFPWAFHLAQSIKQGIFPLWTQLIHSGFPISAEGQIGTFYLPNLLFYYLLPIEQGYAWNTAFHLVLSAFFMIKLMKTFDWDNRAIAFGTMVYLFGATLGGAFYNITSLKVLSWLPFTLFLVDRLMKGSAFRWRSALLLGVVFSLQLLVGYLQFAVYSMLFTGFYFLARLVDMQESRMRAFLMGACGLGLATLIAAVVAFPQLYLTYELAIVSNRANPQEAFAYVGSYSPFSIICMLFPNLEGLFDSKLYLGVFPMFFMIAAFLSMKQTRMKAIYILAIFSFLLALGGFNPLYVLFVKVLKFYSFRTPVKFIFFTGFFLSILSAYGMHLILRESKNDLLERGTKVFLWFTGGIIACVFGAWLCFTLFEAQLYQLGEFLVQKFIYGKPGHPYGWSHYEHKLVNYIAFAKSYMSPASWTFIIPVLKVAGALGILHLLKKSHRKVFYGAAVLLLFVDLNLSYSDIRGDYQDYRSFFRKNSVTEFLSQNLGDQRFFNYSENPAEASLPAGKNMIYGLSTVNAYSPLVKKVYYDFSADMGGVNDSIAYKPVDDDKFVAERLKILGLLNTKYIVTDRALSAEGLEEVFEDRTWRVYQNMYVLPKYQLINQVRVERNFEEIVRQMTDVSFEPSKEVILDEGVGEYFGREDPGLVSEDVITYDEISEMEVRIQVASESDQILLFSQMHDFGWSVYVDGKKERLFKANAVLSAIPIKKGKHAVVLKYEPFKNALWNRKGGQL